MSRTLADLLDEYDYDKIPRGILVENKKSQSQQAAGYLISWDFLILF